MKFKTKNSDDVWYITMQDDDGNTEIRNSRTKEYKIVKTKDFNLWVEKKSIKKLAQ